MMIDLIVYYVDNRLCRLKKLFICHLNIAPKSSENPREYMGICETLKVVLGMWNIEGDAYRIRGAKIG